MGLQVCMGLEGTLWNTATKTMKQFVPDSICKASLLDSEAKFTSLFMWNSYLFVALDRCQNGSLLAN